MSASSSPSSTATVYRGAVPVAATAEDAAKTGTTVTTAVATAATTRVERAGHACSKGRGRPEAADGWSVSPP